MLVLPSVAAWRGAPSLLRLVGCLGLLWLLLWSLVGRDVPHRCRHWLPGACFVWWLLLWPPGGQDVAHIPRHWLPACCFVRQLLQCGSCLGAVWTGKCRTELVGRLCLCVLLLSTCGSCSGGILAGTPHRLMHWPPTRRLLLCVGLLWVLLRGLQAGMRPRGAGKGRPVCCCLGLCKHVRRTCARACCLAAVLVRLRAQLLTSGPAYFQARPHLLMMLGRASAWGCQDVTGLPAGRAPFPWQPTRSRRAAPLQPPGPGCCPHQQSGPSSSTTSPSTTPSMSS